MGQGHRRVSCSSRDEVLFLYHKAELVKQAARKIGFALSEFADGTLGLTWMISMAGTIQANSPAP